MKLEEMVRAGLSRVDAIRVKGTAMNPLLWLVGLVSPLSLILAVVVGDPIARFILFVFASVPLLFALVAYVIYMFRDPDRLQSEEYRIRHRALQMLYRKGTTPEIVDVANQVARIETSAPRIDEGEKK